MGDKPAPERRVPSMVTPFHRIVSSGERPDDEECLERSCHAAMHEYAIEAVSQCSRHDEADGPGICILHFGRGQGESGDSLHCFHLANAEPHDGFNLGTGGGPGLGGDGQPG